VVRTEVSPVVRDIYRARAGDPADHAAYLALLDAAVAWLVERGQAGQWGSQSFSSSAVMREYVRDIVSAGELRVAVDPSGNVVGGCVIGNAPWYAPPVTLVDRYLEALVTDRRLAGRRIGTVLLDDAGARTRSAGASLLRTDCWATAERLVNWYEAHGFQAGAVIDVDGWSAQLLVRPVPPT
jgi:GNAT superfamily N-acetyltransferase